MVKREDYDFSLECKSCCVCKHASSKECNDGSGYTLQDEWGVCPTETKGENFTTLFEPITFEEYAEREKK